MGTLCKNIKNTFKDEEEDYISQEKIEEEKDYISLEKIEEETKSYFINTNPLSLQLKFSLTYVDNKKENYPPYITYFHKLKNNNIGLIINLKYLSIFSLNTFKLVYSIKPEKNNEIINEVKYFDLLGFIELKNNDILLWNSEIIIIYKKIQKNYKLLQIINEFKQGTNYFEYNRYGDKGAECYDLNSLHELRNGLIVSCNSYGLKFYSKNNDKYTLISKKEIRFEVENIIEIKENFFMLFQQNRKSLTSSCVVYSKSISIDYRVSIYNIKNEKERILVEGHAFFCSGDYDDLDLEYSKIKYIIKNKYLLISFPDSFYVYDLSQNMELIREKEMNIQLLCNYYNDLIVIKDLKDKKIKIYEFKDGIFKFYNDFPFQNFRKVFRLNNYNFLAYSDHQLKLLEIK